MTMSLHSNATLKTYFGGTLIFLFAFCLGLGWTVSGMTIPPHFDVDRPSEAERFEMPELEQESIESFLDPQMPPLA